MIVYYVYNETTGMIYYGRTKNTLEHRKRQHLSQVRRGSKTKFHNALRKYGADAFVWHAFILCGNEKDMHETEIRLIATECPEYLLNVTKGGTDGGGAYSCEDPEERARRIEAFKVRRKGKQPALGMKHTPENKAKMKVASDKYWATQKTYNPTEVLQYSSREAKARFGISRGHYCRLKRQSMKDPNDPHPTP